MSEAGNYSVAANFGTCYDSASTGIELTSDPRGVGIITNDITSNISIFPNSANDNVTISGINGTVSIYAINGEVVYNGIITNTLKINTQNLTTGLYIVESNVTENYKLIVE